MPRLLYVLLISLSAIAATVPLDVKEVRPGPITLSSSAESVTVHWKDEAGHSWTADFSLDPKQALIRSIAADGSSVIERARPFYQCVIGKRKGGWDAFFDFPPAHPDGTRAFEGDFQLRSAQARSIGDRMELSFDGMQAGPFKGSIRYKFFPGSRLIQQVAVLATSEPDTAYFYNAGIRMTADADRTPGGNMNSHVSFFDTQGEFRTILSGGPERQPVAVRYRGIAARVAHGSVAVFPTPHQYFFPRDYTTNMGYVWHQAWRGTVGLGIRQLPDDASPYYPWSNAPPGTEQRMSMFLLAGISDTHAVLDEVLRYTHQDRFRALEGYKTFAPHWHFAYTEQAVAKGIAWTPPFKSVLEAMGVDAAMIMDFHGDGHPQDTTELRIKELDDFYRACRAQSNAKFLLMPAEESNVYFGGHWAIAFPKPVYWYMKRAAGEPFRSADATHQTVYRVGDAKEMLDLVRTENGFAYQTHPRTKGSTGYPDKIRDTEHYLDPHYVGAGWKALPSDLSSPRLGERAFKLLDDINNWGQPKRLMGEVDVFQIDATHELYSHMNVNYVKLPSLPSFDNSGELLDSVRRGDFFTTTGEVLLPDVRITETAQGAIQVKARIDHTFPLEMAEIVWGDGKETRRKLIPLTSTRSFEKYDFSAEVDAPGWKWARFAAWDVAADGAFVNPVSRSLKARPRASNPRVEATIRTALDLAGEQRKRVLLRYSSAKAASKIAPPGFIVVDVSDPGLNEEEGPIATVVDASDHVVAEQAGGDVAAFIARNVSTPPSADAVLSSALDQARSENKRVLLDFRADWCVPCFQLDRFLHQPDMWAKLKQNYVIATVDLGFGQGGRELAYKLGSIENDGIPWIAILDQTGKVLATSTVNKRNIGFPTTPEDKARFMALLSTASPAASRRP